MMQEKGHTTALLAGDADLHNAFLDHGQVSELIFNVVPVLEGKGLNLLLDKITLPILRTDFSSIRRKPAHFQAHDRLW